MALPEGLERSYSGGAVPTGLATNISDSATSFAFADASSWPQAANQRFAAFIIDEGKENEEVCWYSDRNTNTVNNVIRGADGTQAFSHAVGASVRHVYTALDAREANAHYANKAPSFIPHEQHVHKTVAQTVSADHTFDGDLTLSGNVSVTGSLNAGTNFHVDTLDVDEINDGVKFLGAIQYATAAGTPGLITPATVAAPGTSPTPMPSDAKIALDVKAFLRAFIPAGTIRTWSGANLPQGLHKDEWLWADGTAIAAATYPEYSTNVGVTWGGTAANPKLPDLRGRVLTGADAAHALGSYGGQLRKKLTIAEMPSHSHGLNNGNHTHYPSAPSVIAPSNEQQHYVPFKASQPPGNNFVHVTFSLLPNVDISVQNTGGDQDFGLEQPYASVRYMVKVH